MDDTNRRVTDSSTGETELRTQEIREEIAQTRVDMAETIEAIQERLTPSHLVAQAGETVRNATTEKVKQMANTAGHAAEQIMDTSFAQTIKSNPIPAAMIGLGAAWLLIKGRSDTNRYDRNRDYGGNPAYGGGEPYRDRDWRTGGPAPEAAVGTSGYGQYGSGATRESSGAWESGTGRGRYGNYGGYGRQAMSFDRVVRDNPIVVGAAAALVGVAIGMSIPASDAENKLMGEARDSVVDRARGLATDAVEKVQEVAGEAANAVTQAGDAARRATVTPGQSADIQGSGSIGAISPTSTDSIETGGIGGTTRSTRGTTRRGTSS